MTKEALWEATLQTKALLTKRTHKSDQRSERMPDDFYRRPSYGEAIHHAFWMLDQLEEFVFDPNKQGKANRWLGFIQGIMFVVKVASIPELKNINKVATEAFPSD